MTRKRMLRVGLYGSFGLAVMFVFLHPFLRQSLFGPTIRDLPLCYWQENFRRAARDDQGPVSLTTKVVRWLGFDKREQFVALPDGADGLRVLLTLVHDPQPRSAGDSRRTSARRP